MTTKRDVCVYLEAAWLETTSAALDSDDPLFSQLTNVIPQRVGKNSFALDINNTRFIVTVSIPRQSAHAPKGDK
jgi:hypothetical protein